MAESQAAERKEISAVIRSTPATPVVVVLQPRGRVVRFHGFLHDAGNAVPAPRVVYRLTPTVRLSKNGYGLTPRCRRSGTRPGKR